MTKEQLGSLILDSERQLYSTDKKLILFSDYDCADAIQGNNCEGLFPMSVH